MRSRMVLKLIDNDLICGDWQENVSKKEIEELLNEKILNNMQNVTYFKVSVVGVNYIILTHAIKYFFIEEYEESNEDVKWPA